MRRAALILAALVLPWPALTFGSVLMTPRCDALVMDQPYDIGVVLSAGIDANGRLDRMSTARTETGIALWQAGQVRRLHLTGDAQRAPDIAAAWAMQDLALRMGVPRGAITVEARSESTLENALFSKPDLPSTERFVLITSGFHAWRGAASFAWVGRRPAALCQSAPFDGVPTRDVVLTVGYEALKWPFNLARAALWTAARAVGLRHLLPDRLLA